MIAEGQNLRLIYTPTNRDCSRALPQYFREAEWAATQPGNRVIFCLIENNLARSISEKHSRLLASHEPDFEVVHFTEEKQRSFASQLLASLPRGYDRIRLNELLLPSGISYGRGPNLAYLLAAVLGATTVHRRDSDILVENLDRLPIEMELAATSQPLGEVRPSPSSAASGRYSENDRGRIVGTGVYGDATIDRRDLLAAGERFLYSFQALGRPGVDENEIEAEARSYLIDEPKRYYADDFYEVDSTGKVEMDAVCLSDVYRLLPEMPTDILGCDYMVNDLNWHLRNPSLFHSRKVRHTYDKTRADHRDLAASTDYAIRDVQYIQMGRIWAKVGERLEADKIYKDSSFDAERYASVWLEEASAATGALAEVRAGAERVYRQAAAASSGEVSSRLLAVAGAVEASGDKMDKRVLAAVDDFCYLARAWHDLVATAGSLELGELLT